MRAGDWVGTILTRLSSRTSPPPGASPIWGAAPVAVTAVADERGT